MFSKLKDILEADKQIFKTVFIVTNERVQYYIKEND